ncbi:MAG: hypothetical protein GDA49_02880 [Rhodospirillales bacterium]|nr:hypothetical protein [Rhodospirillales bacterium]
MPDPKRHRAIGRPRNRGKIQRGYILIRDDRLVAVSPDIATDDADIVEADGMIAMPERVYCLPAPLDDADAGTCVVGRRGVRAAVVCLCDP